MSTFRECPKAVYLLRDDLIEKFKGEGGEGGVTVKMIFAHAPRDEKTGDPKGHALKLGGYACAGIAQINSHKARVNGADDCTIYLDGDDWDDWTESRQRSLIDHELTHFELKLDKEGAVVLDEGTRPMLRIRLHDWQLGGFGDIARRYKDESFEVELWQAAEGKHGKVLSSTVRAPRLAAVGE